VQTLPLSKVRDKLSELVDATSITHEQVVITKNGTPAAVLVGADEWEAMVHPGFPGDSGPWIPSSLVVLSCAA